jgi:WD40 repeat protein
MQFSPISCSLSLCRHTLSLSVDPQEDEYSQQLQSTPATAAAAAAVASVAAAVAPPVDGGAVALATPFTPWRVNGRMRTANAVLLLCLNIGVDPPDVVRPNPCARLECWVNPADYAKPSLAMADIARALQDQFERWQRRARYKVVPDPTANELQRVCLGLRRYAKEERVLFYYNGHGVPKPTENGEIWVFSRDYTQYIPLPLYEVQGYVGTPGLYIFDCNCAGLVVSEFLKAAVQHDTGQPGGGGGAVGGGAENPGNTTNGAAGPRGGGGGVPPPRQLQRDSILLAACGKGELLPMHPELPADLFTCCLTTPIKMSLRWHLSRCPFNGITVEMLDCVPGVLSDRATPLGALNWIFTAITDNIAWNVLPRALFKRLFRQDLLLASLMRNFLLADRIMRSHGCTPVSNPPLPPTHNDELWNSFDLILDHYVRQLPAVSRQARAECATMEAEDLDARARAAFREYVDAHNEHTFGTDGIDPTPRAFEDPIVMPVAPLGFPPFISGRGAGSGGAVGGSGRTGLRGGDAGAGTSGAVDSRNMNGMVEGSLGEAGAGGSGTGVVAGGGGAAGGAGPATGGDVAARLDGLRRGSSSTATHHVTFFDVADDLDVEPRQGEEQRPLTWDILPDAHMMASRPSRVPAVEGKRLQWKAIAKEAEKAAVISNQLRKLGTGEKFELPRFFENQMQGFAFWLDLKSASRPPSNRLPIMLQILLSQTYRVKALHLLARYLQTGPDAVDLALSIGYFPYVEKLLSSHDMSLKKELTFIWGKIVALDPSTVGDIVKVHGERYFCEFAGFEDLQLLTLGAKPVHVVMALFVISCLPRCVSAAYCLNDVFRACLLRMKHKHALVRRWACLCITEYVYDSDKALKTILAMDELVPCVLQLSTDDCAPDVRAAAIALLSALVVELLPLVQISDQPVPSGGEDPSASPSELTRRRATMSGSAPRPVHGRLSSPRSPSSRTDTTSRTDGTGGSGYELSTGSSLPSSMAEGTLTGDSGSNQDAYYDGTGGSFTGSGTPQAGGDARRGEQAADQRQAGDRDLQEQAQILFQAFAQVLIRASTCCASVLVRREVARALSQIADHRLDIYRLGHQLYGIEQRREQQLGGTDLPDEVQPGSTDASCRDLFIALRRYSFDPHPIPYGYAHHWLEKIVDDAFSNHAGGDSFGGGMSHNGSEDGGMLIMSEEQQAVARERVQSGESFPSGLSAIAGVFVGSFPSSTQLPPLPSPSTSSRADTAVSFGGRQVGTSPPSMALPSGRHGLPNFAADGSGHLRSGSGNLDLSRVATQHGRPGLVAAAPAGLGEAQELHRRHSTGNRMQSNSGDHGDGGQLPIYPSVLANGVGQLIRSVSQSFNLIARRDDNPNPPGVGRNAGSSSAAVVSGSRGSDSSGEIFNSMQASRGLASGLGGVGSSSLTGQGVVLGSLGASTRVGFLSENQLLSRSDALNMPSSRPRNVSYHLLNRLASSPPRYSAGRLPMPRVGSFVVAPRNTGNAALRDPSRHEALLDRSPASRSEVRTPFIPGSNSDNARTLYDWSVDCISRLVFETDSPDCMEPDSGEADAGFLENGYSFCTPDEDYFDDEYLEGDATFDDAMWTGMSTDGSDAPAADWGKLICSRKMAASDGSILAMMFLPRHVGPGQDSLLVTGDSHGRVGVYDTNTGKCSGSFGIPGPPGVESASVTSLLCLNKEVSISSYNQPYESAVILAGAVDGRIAVFKSDLLEKKYSIVSTFQGSGFADECVWASRTILPLGAMGNGQREAHDSDSVNSAAHAEAQALADLQHHGNGLVLSYHPSSATLAAAGCQRGILQTWSLETEKNVCTSDIFSHSSGIITTVTMAEELGGKQVVFGGSNGVVGLHDSRGGGTGASLEFGRHATPVVSMSLCPRGVVNEHPGNFASYETDLIASADLGGWIFLWDARMNGREVSRIQAHGSSMLTTMAAHPWRRVFVSGSQSRCVKMFDENNSMSGMILRDPSNRRIPPVTGLCFGPYARLLAVGCADSTVMLFGKGTSTANDLRLSAGH